MCTFLLSLSVACALLHACYQAIPVFYEDHVHEMFLCRLSKVFNIISCHHNEQNIPESISILFWFSEQRPNLGHCMFWVSRWSRGCCNAMKTSYKSSVHIADTTCENHKLEGYDVALCFRSLASAWTYAGLFIRMQASF